MSTMECQQSLLRTLNDVDDIVRKGLESKVLSILGRRYRVGSIIGLGTYSTVHTLVDKDIPGSSNTLLNEMVVKIEDRRTKNPQLRFESTLYDRLQGEIGIPKKIGYKKDGLCEYLIMEGLGPSLKDYLELCGGRFTLKTVLLLAIQLIKRLQSLHSKQLLYRDVKPDNFLTKHDETIYIIDFGLSKRFVEKDGTHIPFRKDKKTVAYQHHLLYHSVNSQRGYETSRRDDLESLGYMLIHFLNGSLPWSGGLGVTVGQNNERIWKRKMEIEALCEGLPPEFLQYMQYCKKLKFDETPDYNYLLVLFRVLYGAERFKDDDQYDWIKMMYDR